MARTGSNNIQAKLVGAPRGHGDREDKFGTEVCQGAIFGVPGKESTIGAAFFTQVLSLNEATIKFDIWDTAGQERYHSLAPMYYRGAAAAVVVYDITSMWYRSPLDRNMFHLQDSFERAKKWVIELQRQGNPNLIMFLVGNKVDLKEKRKVGIEEGEQYAKENGMVFLETSAKTTQNVNELFYEIGLTWILSADVALSDWNALWAIRFED
ncbi:hypothetical protein POTOM_057232 [Populus tomentosa]|uniref:Uncharacterized protein n=1 Tax=Populus tomentosa TaxID=118781 RepID=A0A8X7Y5W0_POPTO|nr:hypothetical protein POTOM_057232 [Populus tomentosa]